MVCVSIAHRIDGCICGSKSKRAREPERQHLHPLSTKNVRSLSFPSLSLYISPLYLSFSTSILSTLFSLNILSLFSLSIFSLFSLYSLSSFSGARRKKVISFIRFGKKRRYFSSGLHKRRFWSTCCLQKSTFVKAVSCLFQVLARATPPSLKITFKVLRRPA